MAQECWRGCPACLARCLFLLCGWAWFSGGQVPSAVPMSLRTEVLSSDKSRAQGPLQTLLSAKGQPLFQINHFPVSSPGIGPSFPPLG